jgi:hypothetical protein
MKEVLLIFLKSFWWRRRIENSGLLENVAGDNEAKKMENKSGSINDEKPV